MFYKFSSTFLFSLITVAFLASACLAKDIPYQHPEYAEIDGKPVCTFCHDDDENITFSRYSHTSYFTENHRIVARQGAKICYMCHKQRSCNNCHAVQSELKPSLREQNSIQKRTQHRGDYLNRHKIDGHISPISCYRCHGNPKSSKTCVRCHGAP